MNYKVLYRKYRPTNFEEIVGQKNTVELLKDSVDNNKISHAYIFSGPRGTGKTSTAKIFAKAINCSCKNDVKPCGNCDNCLSFPESNDIYEIDAASNNGVDQIREIIDNIKLTPINSRYKVYIIDEVHMLSTSAFNALLLTLEEPPSHVVFILATTDIEDVPITVLSRCQRMDFKKISNKDIKSTLKNVAEKENILIEDAAVNEIAEFADGGLRDALSMLDQLSKNQENIFQEMVLSSIGLISTKAIIELLEKIDQNRVEKVLEFIENARENCFDYKTLIKKMINVIKNKAVEIKKGIERTRLSYSEYKKLCIELSNSLYKSNVHVDSYALLELILLDYMSADSNDTKISSSTDKIEEDIPSFDDIVENKETTKSLEIKKDYFLGNKKNFVKIRLNNCFVKASKSHLMECKLSWKDFINATNNKKLKGLLLDTDIVLASDEIMVINTAYNESAEDLNAIIDEIEESYNAFKNANYKFMAISQDRWNEEMSTYKENIKNKKEYVYIEETQNINETTELDDIFSSKKVEVK